MKSKAIKWTAISLALMTAFGAFAGCAQTKTENKSDAAQVTSSGLYFTKQEVRKSPEWVTKLEAAK